MLAPLSAPQAFAVRRDDAGRVPVLLVTGVLDGDTAPQLSAAVCGFGAEKVVVDLHAVEIVAPVGLRDLLLAARVCAVALHVVCPFACRARAIVDATAAPLCVHESRAEALAALTPRR